MSLLAGIDWSTVGLLALVVLAEGVRRVPARAIVVRSVLGGPWELVDLGRERDGWRLVSWWPPATRHLVLLPGGEATAPSEVARRARAPAWTLPALTLLGALALLAVVLGVPLAAARHGGWGLVVAALAAELVAIATSSVAYLGLRRVGLVSRVALRRAAALLSPFAAPRCAEVVLEAALAGVAPAAAMRQLLRPEAFAEWARPRAYDALRGGSDPALGAALGSDTLAALVDVRPPGAAGPYCPRCGRRYRQEMTVCGGCDEIPLVHG